MNARLPPCVGCIGGTVTFEACTGRGDACEPLLCHGRILAKDAHVFHQNDPPTHVHWVRNGLLRLYQTLANGRRQIVGFAFPGEFVDLAAFLIEMHNRTCVGDPAQRDLCLPMPRSDIADYLGLTPETVSRLFTRFVQLGLIALCKRRGVSLLGFAALQRLAQGLPG